MINIVVPLAGQSLFFKDIPFPKPLVEINGSPMIQYVIRYLGTIRRPKRFIFILKQEDVETFHLDNTLKLLSPPDTRIIIQHGATKGAVLSCLLAIEEINNDDPLIISNGDQFIDVDVEKILDQFDQRGVDAGTICFESVHPKWSYARLDDHGQIIETAEKNPISTHAIAGFYYFRRGSDFVKAGEASILSDANVNGLYFVAPTFNELILAHKKLEAIQIEPGRYHSFYSLEKIQEFEKVIPRSKP